MRHPSRTVLCLSMTCVVLLLACSRPEEVATTSTTPTTEAAAPPSQTPASVPASSAAAPAAPAAAAPAPVAAPAPPAPAKPKVARLPAGELITIRTTRDVSTKTAKTGDAFSAILEEPISASGWVVAAAGARIDGRIVEADKGGRVKGKASLTLELTNLTTSDGQKIEIVTSPLASEAAANKSGDAKKIGVGAGAGAAVGAIAGGGSGAAVGALIGGGAGAVMRGDDAVIPAESVLSFELRSPVTITEKK